MAATTASGDDATEGLDTGGSDSDSSGSTGEPAEDSLRFAATARGIAVGAAVATTPLADDPIYQGVLGNEFSLLTPENAGKWGPLQPTPDTWDFSQMDAIVDFAQANGQRVKGHALLWYYQTPPWVSDAMTDAEFEAAVNDHIDQTMSRYADSVWAWDVVNEAIADGLTGTESPAERLRDSIYVDKLGPDYIANAFIRAREQDPDAVLVYNDYDIIGPTAKSDAVYELLSQLLADGVPVDAIGFQTHLQLGRLPGPDAIAANFARFAELGLAIHISEMDVTTGDLGGEQSERLDAQGLGYQLVLQACVEQPACEAVSFWGVTDNYSWLNRPDNPDAPLPFDGDGERKPAYFGARAAFEGATVEVGSTIVENGDFEAGTAGWQATGGMFSATVGAGVGDSMGGVVSNRTEVWMGPAQPLFATFDPWSLWHIRLSARVSAGSQPLNLTLRLGPDDAPVYRGVQSIRADETFRTFSVVFTTPSDGFPEDVLMYVEGAAAGVELTVDDVVVEPITAE